METITLQHVVARPVGVIKLTDVLASLELIDVDVDDLCSGEGLLQRPGIGMVFGRGLPQLAKQQRVLHDPLDWLDEERAHVQQVGLPSVMQRNQPKK